MRLTQSLFIRVVVAALAAIAVILAATALDLRRAYQEAAVRRLLVTLAELRINVEGRIEPGRVAAAQGRLLPLLETSAGLLRGRGAVSLTDLSGLVLVSTDRAQVGERLAFDWPTIERGRRTASAQITGSGIIVVAPVLDAAGDLAGYVALRETSAYIEARAVSALTPLMAVGGGVLLFLLPAAWFGCRLAADRVARAARDGARALDTVREADLGDEVVLAAAYASAVRAAATLDPDIGACVRRIEATLAGFDRSNAAMAVSDVKDEAA
jgi:hypothetical protein